MQRLIDADRFIEKVNKDRQHECYMHSWTANDVLKRLDSYYAPTVLTIPDNPTNGDMIKAMFPQAKIYQSGGYTNCNFKGGTFLEDTTSEWWNSPYKRGTDESNN